MSRQGCKPLFQEVVECGGSSKEVSVCMVQEFVQQGESRNPPLPGEGTQQGQSLAVHMKRCPSDASTTGARPPVSPKGHMM